ncbi:unnamed protein product [Ranitomeya imitator]|uniref:Uncharacterized protein n=1 Tax=Ranitomeya imitator TaxID=111125 RepID=A0ABN9MJ36_9NEOB|nr:unnamed protein product [Ranitomeya imitator]
MKLILVWICLISETFHFPTQSPDVDDTTACCAQNPKLIYQGRDSNSGINVYVFEFLPENKEAKDRVEDTTMKNDHQSNRNSPINTENKDINEDTIIPTNKPASMYDKKQMPDTNTGTRDNTHMPGLKFSTVGATQKDIEIYENTSLLPNTTHGLQTGTSHITEMQKTSGNQDDYYVTDTSALFDFPKNGETYTETGTRDYNSTPDVKFDTITSAVSLAQNDIEMYEDRDLVANITKGLQTGISHSKEVKINEYSNGDDYFGTDESYKG